jgi:secreted trypsin-like serine protease
MSESPSFYTAVSKYNNWIQMAIKVLEKNGKHFQKSNNYFVSFLLLIPLVFVVRE